MSLTQHGNPRSSERGEHHTHLKDYVLPCSRLRCSGTVPLCIAFVVRRHQHDPEINAGPSLDNLSLKGFDDRQARAAVIGQHVGLQPEPLKNKLQLLAGSIIVSMHDEIRVGTGTGLAVVVGAVSRGSPATAANISTSSALAVPGPP